jgi:ribosomal protein S7
MVLKNRKNLLNTRKKIINILYKKFVGLLNKVGFKSKARNILNFALLNASKKLKITPKLLLLNIFLKLNTYLEIKKFYLRKRVVFVPFYVTSYNRRTFLIVKWILSATNMNLQRISFSKKLSFEFISLLTNKNSKSINFKLINIKQALKNRSNIHYRW